METVEIIIYITIAIIVGSLILLATMNLANPQVYEQISGIFTGESDQGFATVDDSSLTQYLFSFWEECNFGVSPQNVTFQYTGETLSKEKFFDEVKRLRLCNTLSSTENDCGSREDTLINTSTGTIEEGILTAQCSRKENKGKLQICKASGCEPSPEPVTCGDNSRDYGHDEDEWHDSEGFCSSGDIEGSTPDFPAEGELISWTCTGTNTDTVCTAYREEDVEEPPTSNPPSPDNSCQDYLPGMTQSTLLTCPYTHQNNGFNYYSCDQFYHDEVGNHDTWSNYFGQQFPKGNTRTFHLIPDTYASLSFNSGSFSSGSITATDLPLNVNHGIYSKWWVSISECPGDFSNDLGNCVEEVPYVRKGSGFQYSVEGNDDFSGCKLKENTEYYFNIMFYDPQDSSYNPSCYKEEFSIEEGRFVNYNCGILVMPTGN